LAEILHEAGLREGVLSLMHVPGSTAAERFLAGGVDKLFFTGSTSVGRSLMEQAAQSLTPVSLELGGNDAMIVLEDAHLPRAAAGAIWAGISNAGQSCGAVERVYVADAVYERFVTELRRRLRELEVGDPSRPNADLGSLSTPDQRQTVIEHVEDARRRGARVLQAGRFSAGEGRSGRESPEDSGTGHGGLYYPPTLIEGATPEMRCMQDETFGPVLALRKVTGAEEAVTEANQSPYGLTASVWSRDRRRAESVAAQLHAGAVTINDHLMSHGMPETAWGGYKYSGIGRTHGAEGFREMTRTKTVVRDRTHRLRTNLWWHPYNRRLVHGLEGAVDGVLHPAGIGLLRRIRGLGRLLRLVVGRLRR
jgi:succinate-semialdehyde dehydrogenase/glutarate-semialdehyde dehydrogenase